MEGLWVRLEAGLVSTEGAWYLSDNAGLVWTKFHGRAKGRRKNGIIHKLNTKQPKNCNFKTFPILKAPFFGVQRNKNQFSIFSYFESNYFMQDGVCLIVILSDLLLGLALSWALD